MKNSLSPSPTSILAHHASRALTALDLSALQSVRNPTPTATPTVSASLDSQYVTRQEFIRWQNQTPSGPQNYSQVGPTPPPNSYNVRNRCTTDGRPICNNCNRVGHIASRFANQARQSFAPSRFNMAQTGYPQRQLPYYNNQHNTFPDRQLPYQNKDNIIMQGTLKILVLIKLHRGLHVFQPCHHHDPHRQPHCT